MMRNKRTIFFLLGIFFSITLCAQDYSVVQGNVKMDFRLDKNGAPVYTVYYKGKPIIKPSKLGFSFVEAVPMQEGFEITGSDSSVVDTTWSPVWGEVSKIRDYHKERVIYLRQKTSNRLLNIRFRVFEDGVGFRYEFPLQPAFKNFIVSAEHTEFNLTGDHKSFWMPGDYDTNEYPYTVSAISAIDNTEMVKKSTDICVRTVTDAQAVQTPLMLKTAEGVYINIHEAALINYPAMQLHVDRTTYSLTASLVPDAMGNKAYLRTPCNTPWRTIVVSDKATDILASKLILNLNEPSVITNTLWIRPMKFVGVWWELQTGKSNWNYANDTESVDKAGGLIPHGKHGANTENVKRYIDFAARNGIQGVLVEGWNVGWEEWFGTWKEHVFDFAKPYPDFNVAEITSYAAKNGVQMIMHNETSGSATDYERQLDTAFRFMNKFGYTSVKTGYVGKIIPRGEHHDGQWMVNHYQRVAEKAAAHKVMIDVHEPVRPTGLQRTYPNWLASEAGRGNEYHAFSNGNAPDHVTILPFTRLMGGPMDYTPGIFRLKNYGTDKTRQVNSTLAKQLALYVTIYSPLQMAADLPENYEAHMDAFQFIKDVPVDWDDTKIVAAEPGDYVVIARKEKGANNWYIGAVTDEDTRTFTVELSFLDKSVKYEATIYGDADNADWKDNPEAYKVTHVNVDNRSKLVLKLARGGGAAVSIRQINAATKTTVSNK